MNNQAEVTVAMQGVDDVMDEMWKSIRYNDTALDSERVEATFVVDVTRAYDKLMEALRALRDAYRFYGVEAPQPDGETMEARSPIDAAPLEQQHPSND